MILLCLHIKKKQTKTHRMKGGGTNFYAVVIKVIKAAALSSLKVFVHTNQKQPLSMAAELILSLIECS